MMTSSLPSAVQPSTTAIPKPCVTQIRKALPVSKPRISVTQANALKLYPYSLEPGRIPTPDPQPCMTAFSCKRSRASISSFVILPWRPLEGRAAPRNVLNLFPTPCVAASRRTCDLRTPFPLSWLCCVCCRRLRSCWKIWRRASLSSRRISSISPLASRG